MAIGIPRCLDIAKRVKEVGVDAAIKEYGLAHESVTRYCREARRVERGALATGGDHAPRILVYDIETAPLLAYVWKCYDECISPAQVVQHGDILCWAGKWLGEDVVLSDSREHDKDDERICRSLHELFEKADVVIAHNGRAFDQLMLNTRWVNMGLPPPMYKSIDTLAIAKSMFRFQINKLDYIARYLGIGKKVEHEGFDLWLKCMAGDADAWERMREYNVGDVFLLEEVYLKMRPWDKKHPNIGLMYQDGVRRCVACGWTEFDPVPKLAYTGVSSFPAIRCQKCGKVMRLRVRDDIAEVANVL